MLYRFSRTFFTPINLKIGLEVLKVFGKLEKKDWGLSRKLSENCGVFVLKLRVCYVQESVIASMLR